MVRKYADIRLPRHHPSGATVFLHLEPGAYSDTCSCNSAKVGVTLPGSACSRLCHCSCTASPLAFEIAFLFHGLGHGHVSIGRLVHGFDKYPARYETSVQFICRDRVMPGSILQGETAHRQGDRPRRPISHRLVTHEQANTFVMSTTRSSAAPTSQVDDGSKKEGAEKVEQGKESRQRIPWDDGHGAS